MPRLISIDQLEGLPIENEPRFAAMEEIMRNNHEKWVEQLDEPLEIARARHAYMSAVITASRELGIDALRDLYTNGPSNIDDDDFDNFINAVEDATIRIALREGKKRAPFTVGIPKSTKARLIDLSNELRSEVQKLNIASARKEVLMNRIDQFIKDLDGTRLNFANVALLASYALSLVSDLGGAASTVRATVNSIQEVVGTAKFQEDGVSGLALPYTEVLMIAAPEDSKD